MRHPRLIIFSGAFLALALMSLLSALLGHILPTLLPRRYTTIAAAGLFFVFGARMLQEGMALAAGTGHIEEEMREVQREVEAAAQGIDLLPASNPPVDIDLEAGPPEPILPHPALDAITVTRPRSPRSSPANSPRPRPPSPPSSPAIHQFQTPAAAASPTPQQQPQHKRRRSSLSSLPAGATARARDTFADGARNLCHLFFSPVLVQAFVLTFLAEWGDRSQITTIALAAAHVCLPTPEQPI